MSFKSQAPYFASQLPLAEALQHEDGCDPSLGARPLLGVELTFDGKLRLRRTLFAGSRFVL